MSTTKKRTAKRSEPPDPQRTLAEMVGLPCKVSIPTWETIIHRVAVLQSDLALKDRQYTAVVATCNRYKHRAELWDSVGVGLVRHAVRRNGQSEDLD